MSGEQPRGEPLSGREIGLILGGLVGAGLAGLRYFERRPDGVSIDWAGLAGASAAGLMIGVVVGLCLGGLIGLLRDLVRR